MQYCGGESRRCGWIDAQAPVSSLKRRVGRQKGVALSGYLLERRFLRFGAGSY
jgi:hypothetical protein